MAFSGFLDIKKYDRTFGAADDQGNSFLSFPKRTTTLHEKPRSLENIYINREIYIYIYKRGILSFENISIFTTPRRMLKEFPEQVLRSVED